MRPYYAGVLGRRNHNHNSSSAHTGTKAQMTIRTLFEKDKRKLV